MRRVFPSLFVVILLAAGAAPAPATAQVENAVRLFDEGNQLYRDGRYQEALDVYYRAIAQGYHSGALFYNMGNAYYRLDSLGQAIRYYEKSRVLTPDHPELMHSLDIARARQRDQFSRVPRPVWVEWWASLVERSAGRWLFWIGMGFYLIAAALFAQWVRTRTRNPWHRRARSLALMVAVVLLVGAFTASVQSEAWRVGVIVAAEVPLRQGPGPDAATEMTVHEGLVVDVVGESGPWLYVRLPNGVTGWVAADVLADV